MTEEQWLTSSNPKRMLAWLLGEEGGAKLGASDRKLRLFVCALARVSPTPVVAKTFEEIERLDGLKGNGGMSEDPPGMARGWVAADMKWLAPPASRAALLRDTFRPFRPVTAQPAWRTPTVTSLAQATYEERLLPSGHLDLTRLGVLSDALEEAGCTDADILSHLRSPGPHVRGCWALDLVLGKS